MKLNITNQGAQRCDLSVEVVLESDTFEVPKGGTVVVDARDLDLEERRS